MNPKELHFDQEGRDKLLKGITLLSKAVKSTLGPSGHTAMLESPNHTKGMTITKDGVTVAKNFDIDDPVANMAVNLMKEAAENTAITAGDGTTTAIVLTEAIIKNGMQYMEEHPDTNVHDLIKNIKSDSEDAIKYLNKTSKKVSGKTLESVATISANNNKFLGKMIANAYKDLGKDGKYITDVKGELTIHGVTKSIESKATFVVENGIITAESSLKVLVADYGIDIPSVVKENIAKEIEISIKANYELLERS